MAKEKKNFNTDLEDSERDKKYVNQDEFSIEIPDVKDIPGQQHIHPPRLNEMVDTTASSADEEGEHIFKDEEDDASDVTETEREVLEKSANSMGSEDDEAWEKIQLDAVDEDGEKLNEKNDLFGEDLDVPGAEQDDDDEDIGEEDEENNSYSWSQ